MQAGNVIGNYKVIDKIGEGGMGAVFKGIDLMLEREVAIKMLRPELASQPQVVERFRSEAVTLARLNHPNIATLYSFLRQGEDFFMVMEFVRGETLDSLIRRSGAMSCNHAITLFCQALEGIDHAHRMGIVHRDIKPANMMLTEMGTLKVMDFGIARVLGTSRMTKQGNIVGTIEYMSPEQVRGQETDARSDIYSLGILLYEMLTGRVPFSSDSEYDLMKMQIESAPPPPRVFSNQIPQPVEQAIMRALAKRSEARFQGAGEFRDVLSSAIGIPVAPTPHTPPIPVLGTVPLASAPGMPSAAPMAEQPIAPHSIAEQPKETRLAGGDSAAGLSDQIRQTRLADQQSSGPVYDSFQTSAPSAPPLAKSNVKLLIGIAAVVVVAIIGAAIFLLTSGTKTGNSPAATPSAKPIQSATPPTSPSTGVSQAPAQTPAQVPAPSQSQAPAQLGPASSQTDRVVGSETPGTTTPGAAAAPTKVAKTRKEGDADAAARKEKERKAAEARRLLNQ
ncbi:MAG TPA: protein kinase [Blastocatellia bacterium]|nr:protein kinase [Blastocatellia bacterium]